MSRKKDFQQRDGECAYCEFEGNVLVFENGCGEEVEVCGACVEEAWVQMEEEGLPRRI